MTSPTKEDYDLADQALRGYGPAARESVATVVAMARAQGVRTAVQATMARTPATDPKVTQGVEAAVRVAESWARDLVKGMGSRGISRSTLAMIQESVPHLVERLRRAT